MPTSRRRLMAGNYGPLGKMKTAIAAFTPNMPWARLGASGIVDFDGNGTSAATPQVAAAAALWIQKNRGDYDEYPQAWMKVEVVRKALFGSAHVDPANASHFGRGKLASLDALGVAPAKAADLRARKLAPDAANFPIFSMLTGLGVAAVPQPRQAMLELEILQLLSSSRFDTPIPDVSPGAQAIDPRSAARLAEELLAKPGLSTELRKALRDGGAGAPSTRQPATRYKNSGDRSDQLHLEMATKPVPPVPAARQLRVYAYDPSLASDLAYFGINEATISIDWEERLATGTGRRISRSGRRRSRQRQLLRAGRSQPSAFACQSGLRAIGGQSAVPSADGLRGGDAHDRRISSWRWAARRCGRRAMCRDAERKLCLRRIREPPPHLSACAARREFLSTARNTRRCCSATSAPPRVRCGTTLPGSRVFCAVSHDIIAHETTHALLDGLHRRYQEVHQSRCARLSRGLRRHRRAVSALQHSGSPYRGQMRKTRGDLRHRQPSRQARDPVRPGHLEAATARCAMRLADKPPDRTDYETKRRTA